MESILWRSPGFQHAQSHYVESPTMPSEPAWTTARCNRLLRPLSSKISLLRKSRLLDGTRRSSGEEMSSFSSSSTQSDATNGDEGTSTLASTLGVHRMNWDPSPRPRKKVKLTYSSREPIHPAKGRTVSAHVIPSKGPPLPMAPNFMNVDHSLLLPIGPHEFRSRHTEIYWKADKCLQPGNQNKKARSQEIFRRYAISAYPDCWKLLDGIHSGLESLLKATSKNLTGERHGARSLYSTCLRKTPEYIAMHERWRRAEDPESADDISSSIYAHLETVGARSILGASALQEVVRAHGVNMIGSAVIDGLICFPIASRIVKLCLHLEAYDEAQYIVECILEQKSFPKPTSRDDVLFNKELSILDQFTIITGRLGFLYRKLTTLFENRLLPIEWISSPDMIERWSGVIQCISERTSDAKDAGILLRTVILMSEVPCFTLTASQIHHLRTHLSNGPSDASEGRLRLNKPNETASVQIHEPSTLTVSGGEASKTGLRLLAALCALEFAQSLAVGSNVANTSVLQVLAIEARQIIEAQELVAPSVEKSGFGADVPCLVLLAAGLSSSMAKEDAMELYRYLNIFGCKNLTKRFPNKAASFLGVVASWRGQALASDGFECIQEIIQQLLRVSRLGCCPLETRTLIGTIATTAAIQYASITSKPKHLTWALETETRVNGMSVGLTCQTPRRMPEHRPAKAHLGFRWEEGICEWVAGTPGVPKPKPVIYRDVNGTVSDSESIGKPDQAVALDASPSQLPCRQEASSASNHSHSLSHTRRVVPGSLTKTSRSTFLGVAISCCSQASIQASQCDLQDKMEQTPEASSEVGGSELSNPKSRHDRPACNLEKQIKPTRQLKELVQRASDRGKRRPNLKTGKDYTSGQRRYSRRGPIKQLMEAVESEDELNLQ